MKKWFFGIIFSLLALVSCNEDMLDPSGGLEPVDLKSSILINGIETTVCGTETFPLTAGQTYVVGNVFVSNDETNLYVTYKLNYPGHFGSLHLWVGTDLATTPKNSQGTPIPGQFPYKMETGEETYLNGSWIVTEYTFTIPLTTIPNYAKCGNTLYFLAHAETTCDMNSDGDFTDEGEGSIEPGTWITSSETAWAGSIVGTGTERWFFYDDFIVACCGAPVVTGRLETAFAKPSIQQGGYVFVSPTLDRKTKLDTYKNNPERYPYLNITQNRWGWATNLAVAEDVLPPTLNYSMQYSYRTSQGPGGYYVYVEVPNMIQVTNDENNLYITYHSGMTNNFVYLNSINGWSGVYFISNQPDVITIPFSSIPNYLGCGNPIYFSAGGIHDGRWHYTLQAGTLQGLITYNSILPISGTAEFPIYAGAGLNDITNGTLVGKAYVSYNGTTLKLTYDLDEGYEMEEVHIYADDAIPTKVAPGQFGFNTYFDPMVTDFETEFDVPDTNGDGKIWFILHAVVNI